MMNAKNYLVTGAAGHLGNTILTQLLCGGKNVRGLILNGEKPVIPAGRDEKSGGTLSYIEGDIRNKQSLEPLFQGLEGAETVVIHTAGMIDIADRVSKIMYEVNVGGTENIVALCMAHQVSRLVHVSSVHAIPEKDGLEVLEEVDSFSPNQVEGGYAKTKAEATQLVLDAVKLGLNAVVVHPSGILGPNESSGNHLVQMVKSYVQGRLPACVRGGYDFVDVRDVAQGCISAAEKGRTGQCYILSNRHYDVKEVLQMVRRCNVGRPIPVLPMWMAKAAAPLLGFWANRKKQKPLYTKYSLYTLTTNDRFSHDKATMELDYRPRDLLVTIRDTVRWLMESKSARLSV